MTPLLINALEATRRRALGLTQFEVNFRAGLQDGYVNKIECDVPHFGHMSLDVVLEMLGLELVVSLRP